MNRVYSIDYLRGILAILVMIYHYMYWNHLLVINAQSFLTRNALYGVSIFFTISGFALTIVYSSSLSQINIKILSNYMFKRFIRIYPLFWLILSFYLLFLYLTNSEIPTFMQIIASYTITFPFFEEYRGGLTAGSWSIGIEIIFYIIFPFILLFLTKNKKSLFFLLFIVITFLLFSAYDRYESCSIKHYWSIYLNLSNHIYFFLIGILFGILYIKKEELFYLKKIIILLGLFLILGLIIFYPINGKIVCLLYEHNRVILSLFYILLFYLVLTFEVTFKIKSLFFIFLGDISYTVYLSHPIVNMYMDYYLFKGYDINKVIKISILIVITLIVSALIHYLYEIPIKKYLSQTRNNYVSR